MILFPVEGEFFPNGSILEKFELEKILRGRHRLLTPNVSHQSLEESVFASRAPTTMPTLPHDVGEWIVGYPGAPLTWLRWLGVCADAAAARKLQRGMRAMLARSRFPWRQGAALRVQYRVRTIPRWDDGVLVHLGASQWAVKMKAQPPRKWYVFVPNDRVRIRIAT